MHFKFRNIQETFHSMVRMVKDGTIPTTATSSRYGSIRKITEPVIITYEKPTERVLINPARDCNCHFHVYESLWMLAGKNDLASLEYYNGKMKDFSDNGVTFNSPYGYRWRHANPSKYKMWEGTAIIDSRPGTGIDQLQIIISQLKRKPDSRRCLLQIWDVEEDLLRIDTTKDNACNFAATFRINPATNALDISVHNRSNDMIWGAMGANAVQFSFLLEYMAASIGVPVGCYHQITDDLHIYDATWHPEEWLREEWPTIDSNQIPLVKDPHLFDQEVVKFVELLPYQRAITNWQEPFLQHIAAPMANVFNLHKDRHYDMAIKGLELIEADDWRLAATQWINKRKKAWELVQQAGLDKVLEEKVNQ